LNPTVVTKFQGKALTGGVKYTMGRKILRGGVQHAKKLLGTLYMREHGMRNSNQILHGDQTILEKNYRVHHTTCPSQKLTGRIIQAVNLFLNHYIHTWNECAFSHSVPRIIKHIFK